MEVEDDLFYYGLLEQCTITDDDEEEEEEEPVLEKSSMVVCCTPVLDHKEQDEKSTTTPETTPQPDSTTTTSTSTIIHYYTPEDSVSNETETDRHDGECWPRLVSINNNDEDTTDGDTSHGGDPNDWEVLSVASSVWTLDTFAETTKTFLEVLVEERSSSSSPVMVRPALETSIPSSIDGPPKTISRPASTEKAPRKLKKLVGGDDDHIEDPDNMVLCWDSIRDDYKNGRGGRLSRRFKGNPKQRTRCGSR
jgi:hypothetical protein